MYGLKFSSASKSNCNWNPCRYRNRTSIRKSIHFFVNLTLKPHQILHVPLFQYYKVAPSNCRGGSTCKMNSFQTRNVYHAWIAKGLIFAFVTHQNFNLIRPISLTSVGIGFGLVPAQNFGVRIVMRLHHCSYLTSFICIFSELAPMVW